MTSKLAPIATLEILNGPLAGKVFQLEGEILIGRKEENSALPVVPDISLPDSRVSRRHARLFIKAGHYFLEDLSSTNGTFYNAHNSPLHEPVMMRKRSNVRVGETHMRFSPVSNINKSSSKENISSPWQSEIGLNEQVFDFSKTSTQTNDK